jgi:VanZ family protein
VQSLKNLLRWLPSVLLMSAIFLFSSIPSKEMPNFGSWDTLVKKGGHALGYGLLALSYWYALKWNRKLSWLAFLFAALYALSDEFHQSFVPGRHPSWVDALLIDNGGAVLALITACLTYRKNRER